MKDQPQTFSEQFSEIPKFVPAFSQSNNMNKDEQINIRIQPDIKKVAFEILRKNGMSPSLAIQLFLRKVIKENKIPNGLLK